MSYMTISSQEKHNFSLCSCFHAHPTTLLKILEGTNAWAVPPPQILGGPSSPVPPRSPPLPSEHVQCSKWACTMFHMGMYNVPSEHLQCSKWSCTMNIPSWHALCFKWHALRSKSACTMFQVGMYNVPSEHVQCSKWACTHCNVPCKHCRDYCHFESNPKDNVINIRTISRDCLECRCLYIIIDMKGFECQLSIICRSSRYIWRRMTKGQRISSKGMLYLPNWLQNLFCLAFQII